MSNTFITPTVVARRALATLYNSTVFLPLVWRDFDVEFQATVGQAVTVRKPATFTAAEFSSSINVQNATESSTTVTLDKYPDVSFQVTSREQTLDIDDYSTRLIQPAAEALAQYVDADIAENLVDAAEGVGGGGTSTWSSSTPSTVFTGQLGARAKLGRAKLPLTDRFAVFSPESAGECLKEALFVQANTSGSTDALREGSIGRVFGFDSYESQQLGDSGSDDSSQADGLAFHRHACAVVTRPLEVPNGTNNSAVESYKGLALRVTTDYSISTKADITSLDLLYGVDALRPEAAIQLSLGIGS